jgi:hypothetical protein
LFMVFKPDSLLSQEQYCRRNKVNYHNIHFKLIHKWIFKNCYRAKSATGIVKSILNISKYEKHVSVSKE